jgi:hypothetical protein
MWCDVAVLVTLFWFVMADGMKLIECHPIAYFGIGFLGATAFLGLLRREIAK